MQHLHCSNNGQHAMLWCKHLASVQALHNLTLAQLLMQSMQLRQQRQWATINQWHQAMCSTVSVVSICPNRSITKWSQQMAVSVMSSTWTWCTYQTPWRNMLLLCRVARWEVICDFSCMTISNWCVHTFKFMALSAQIESLVLLAYSGCSRFGLSTRVSTQNMSSVMSVASMNTWHAKAHCKQSIHQHPRF